QCLQSAFLIDGHDGPLALPARDPTSKTELAREIQSQHAAQRRIPLGVNRRADDVSIVRSRFQSRSVRRRVDRLPQVLAPRPIALMSRGSRLRGDARSFTGLPIPADTASSPQKAYVWVFFRTLLFPMPENRLLVEIFRSEAYFPVPENDDKLE